MTTAVNYEENHVDAQDDLDRNFTSVIDRLVTRMFPDVEQKERLAAEAELAGLAQCIMLQTIHHISGKDTPWENGR